ncbi:MAG: hypothetical protein PHP59_01380 [Methanofollis sp.]|uniref:hypothetical protein n=1 Tax=Methanofollis sp. TaxID=2052835 RepID=UPI0026121A66|nr:hypothetical protein [Methanofollis sp.]MDD4254005.1 hypothetical protein [Methanofollis sp.]
MNYPGLKTGDFPLRPLHHRKLKGTATASSRTVGHHLQEACLDGIQVLYLSLDLTDPLTPTPSPSSKTPASSSPASRHGPAAGTDW